MIHSSIYEKDLQTAYESICDIERLNGCKVLVTGGTGLVGEPLVDMLIKAQAVVTVAARNENKVREKFGQNVDFLKYDATSDNSFCGNYDYIIHAASNAYPEAIMEKPAETLIANVMGVGQLLEYARVDDTKRVLFISSSEVYGRKETDGPFEENMYGYVDVLSSRASYPMGKRAAENLCMCYKDEYDVDVVIARLGHIYGPNASLSDNRVSSQFAHMAARGEKIVMKSDGSQLRSYTYSLDCAAALLTVLLNGTNGEAYNIASGEAVSIRQMAEILANSGNVLVKFEEPNEKEKMAFNPMNNSTLDCKKLESLGFKSQFNAECGLSHTVETIKELLDERAD